MAVLSGENRRVMEAAKRLYAEKLRDELEPQYNGQIIAVEPESGEYVLVRTFTEACDACRTRFGQKLTHMFRVGGGGAVSIGSGKRYGRIPGRA